MGSGEERQIINVSIASKRTMYEAIQNTDFDEVGRTQIKCQTSAQKLIRMNTIRFNES